MKKSIFFWSFIAAIMGGVLFHTKNKVQKLEDQLTSLDRQILRERESLHILNAEWHYLNRPDRLAALNERYLNLTPMEPQSIQTIARVTNDNSMFVDVSHSVGG
jgi:hypothetical protein